MTYVYKKGQKCTKETIAEEQARLKKEPDFIIMEEWRQIVINGEKWDYEVSDCGNVRNIRTGKRLKPQKSKKGYLRVGLYKNEKYNNFQVHRLVANAFIPNPNNLETVNHINENKEDNRVENLEWLSRENNTKYGTRSERSAKSREKRVKCVETGIIYESISKASEKTGFSRWGIGMCCNEKLETCGGYHWKFIN